MQQWVDVAHFPSQYGLSAAVREASSSTSKSFVMAEIVLVAFDFGDVGMRWPILLSHDRMCLLDSLLVLLKLTINHVISAKIPWILHEPGAQTWWTTGQDAGLTRSDNSDRIGGNGSRFSHLDWIIIS